MAPPRPTLRCLRDDLQSDWENVGHQRAVVDLAECPPLHLLEHPAITHAVATFGDESADAQRESISGLSNPVWWKLKTTRWRGAVFVDEGGQAWLCAAGLRREREATDFYRSFMARVNAWGPEAFLPTEEDRQRLAHELAEARLGSWEHDVQARAITALGEAWGSGAAEFEIPSLDPARTALGRVNVQVERIEEDGDSIAEVVVDVRPTDWAMARVLDRAEIVLLAAIQPDSQAWTPGHFEDHRIYSIVGTAAEIERLVEVDRGDTPPGAFASPSVAHYAHRARLVENYVEGTASRALCGVYFVPTRDPEGLPTCEMCAVLVKHLAGRVE